MSRVQAQQMHGSARRVTLATQGRRGRRDKRTPRVSRGGHRASAATSRTDCRGLPRCDTTTGGSPSGTANGGESRLTPPRRRLSGPTGTEPEFHESADHGTDEARQHSPRKNPPYNRHGLTLHVGRLENKHCPVTPSVEPGYRCGINIGPRW
jgi:hypothetical protein